MKKDQDSSFSPMFRNTRSRLYQRKPSTDLHDRSDSKEQPIHTGQHWKAQGNHAFKERQYDKAIDCYSKAIVPALPDADPQPRIKSILLQSVEVLSEERRTESESKGRRDCL